MRARLGRQGENLQVLPEAQKGVAEEQQGKQPVVHEHRERQAGVIFRFLGEGKLATT